MGILHNVVQDFKIVPEDVPRIEEALFFDGPNQRKNVERFGTLMFFATAIATFGVIADSTATVIGAMLIAPLMTPILAAAAGIVTGNLPRARRSLLTALGGVILAIALSCFFGVIYRTGVISIATNSQIASRTSPSLIDLYGALAAGAVGAFAVSRKDVADTLPGAAIAIALVPPLAVVGLTLSQGAWSDAWGALLLFLTNFFAILLAGGAVLALLGLGATETSDLHGPARKRAFTVIIVGTVLVAIPLAITSLGVLTSALAQSTATEVTQQWIEGTPYIMHKVDTTSSGILIRIGGSGDQLEVGDLKSALADSMEDGAAFRLEIIAELVEEFEIGSNGTD